MIEENGTIHNESDPSRLVGDEADGEVEFVPEKEDTPEDRDVLGKLRERLKQCQKEQSEYLEGWQRAKADFINYRKDEARRFEDLAQFVTTGLVQDLLPVLDSFEMGLRNSQQPASPELQRGESTGNRKQEIEKGFLLIRSQVMDVLKKRGLEVVEAKQGDRFNPEYHESVAETEADQETGTIVEEIQKGYALRGRVIRPARVRLAKAKSG